MDNVYLISSSAVTSRLAALSALRPFFSWDQRGGSLQTVHKQT